MISSCQWLGQSPDFGLILHRCGQVRQIVLAFSYPDRDIEKGDYFFARMSATVLTIYQSQRGRDAGSICNYARSLDGGLQVCRDLAIGYYWVDYLGCRECCHCLIQIRGQSPHQTLCGHDDVSLLRGPGHCRGLSSTTDGFGYRRDVGFSVNPTRSESEVGGSTAIR